MKKKIEDFVLLVYGDTLGTINLIKANPDRLKIYYAEIDIKKDKWRVTMPADLAILGGRNTNSAWRDIGEGDFTTDRSHLQSNALICIYDPTNFKHLVNMVHVASEALETAGSVL
jgi:hypothetical protein